MAWQFERLAYHAMTTPDSVLVVASIGVAAVGVISFWVGVRFERYHAHRFSEHIDRLKSAPVDDHAEIVDEFMNDESLDRAARYMFLLQMIGVGLFLTGVTLAALGLF